MGTAFAGIIRTPLTSVIMIFELTRDYSIIVPLMISNLISYFISARLQSEPIYEALVHQDGIHLPRPEHKLPKDQRRISAIMRQIPELPSPEDTTSEALRLAHQADLDLVPILTGSGMAGVLSLAALEAGIAQGNGNQTLAEGCIPAAAQTYGEFPHLHPDHGLMIALNRIGTAGSRTLPVVSRTNIHDLVGILHAQDVLQTLGVISPPPGDLE
jgi:CIC family chloride channel protein